MPSATNSGGSTASSSAVNTGTSPACSACKYQRKKCSKNCLLAPYFPHNRQQQFLNAHKLFGVSNITKMIKDLDEPHRAMAMSTIIMEADARARDPVGGCYRMVRSLQQQIECSKAELDVVLQQLSLFRARHQERQEISLGYGDLPEQQGYVVNCQNLNNAHVM